MICFVCEISSCYLNSIKTPNRHWQTWIQTQLVYIWFLCWECDSNNTQTWWNHRSFCTLNAIKAIETIYTHCGFSILIIIAVVFFVQSNGRKFDQQSLVSIHFVECVFSNIEISYFIYNLILVDICYRYVHNNRYALALTWAVYMYCLRSHTQRFTRLIHEKITLKKRESASIKLLLLMCVCVCETTSDTVYVLIITVP